jgi:hypothetical protein
MDGSQVSLAQALGMAGLTFAAGLVYGWISACLRGGGPIGADRRRDPKGGWR